MGTLICRQRRLMKALCQLAVDIFFYIALVIPIAIFNLTKLAEPNTRGFFCSDVSIRYPYRRNTVPSLTLFLVGLPVVAAVTAMIECAYFKLYPPKKRGVFHPLIVAVYRVFGFFIVGASINQILTDVTKLTIGRLRPMFLDVCQPSVTCNSTNEYVYVDDYECTRTVYEGFTNSELEEMLSDIRKSFPSGHASFAMYCAIYAVFYLELRMKYRPARMLKIFCQALAIIAAVYCCCTRFLDNKHHATDIVFGAIYGTTIGAFAIYMYYRSLTSPTRKMNRLNSMYSASPTSVANKTAAQIIQRDAENNEIGNENDVVVREDSSQF